MYIIVSVVFHSRARLLRTGSAHMTKAQNGVFKIFKIKERRNKIKSQIYDFRLSSCVTHFNVKRNRIVLVT